MKLGLLKVIFDFPNGIYTIRANYIENIREQSFMFYSCLGVPVRWVWTTPIFCNKLGM
jgi:hypothetical protein